MDNKILRIDTQKIMQVVLIFFMALWMGANLQAQSNDAELWTGVGIKKKINKQWAFSLMQQIRLDGQISAFSSTLTNAALHYKLGKMGHLAQHYRFSITPTENINRLHTDLQYKLPSKNKKWIINPRVRYQWQRSTLDEKAHLIRPKFSLAYKVGEGKFKPYISNEYFLNVTNMAAENEGMRLTRYRFYAGFDYKIAAKQKMHFHYMYQKTTGDTSTPHDHIIGVFYYFLI